MTKVDELKEGELEPAEQIEKVRRILVLEQLGIDIPINYITGEIDN